MGDIYAFPVEGIMRWVRTKGPSHHKLLIHSFASVSKSLGKDGHIESPQFPAVGHTWTMSVYLQGDSKKGGQGCLSMYLNKVDESGEAQFTVRFFIYDYIRDHYLIIQDSSVMEYSKLNKTFGIAEALELAHFTAASNGFVRYDRCCFGVEVQKHVVRATVSSFEPYQHPQRATVLDVSRKWDSTTSYTRLPDIAESPSFTLFERQWNIRIHPRGDAAAAKQSLSMFLCLKTDLEPGQKLFAEYELCVRNLNPDKDIKKPIKHWFSKTSKIWGIPFMIPLSILEASTEGYLFSRSGLSCLSFQATIKNLFVLTSS